MKIGYITLVVNKEIVDEKHGLEAAASKKRTAVNIVQPSRAKKPKIESGNNSDFDSEEKWKELDDQGIKDC